MYFITPVYDFCFHNWLGLKAHSDSVALLLNAIDFTILETDPRDEGRSFYDSILRVWTKPYVLLVHKNKRKSC